MNYLQDLKCQNIGAEKKQWHDSSHAYTIYHRIDIGKYDRNLDYRDSWLLSWYFVVTLFVMNRSKLFIIGTFKHQEEILIQVIMNFTKNSIWRFWHVWKTDHSNFFTKFMNNSKHWIMSISPSHYKVTILQTIRKNSSFLTLNFEKLSTIFYASSTRIVFVVFKASGSYRTTEKMMLRAGSQTTHTLPERLWTPNWESVTTTLVHGPSLAPPTPALTKTNPCFGGFVIAVN